MSPTSGTEAGTLTIGVNTAGLLPQTYRGVVTVAADAATNSPQIISVTLNVNAASSTVIGGVVNFRQLGGPCVAPGELVTIAGSLLEPSAGISGGVDLVTGKLVTQLAGTTVTFNGVAAPLLYVSASQINAIVRYEVVSSRSGSTRFRLNVTEHARVYGTRCAVQTELTSTSHPSPGLSEGQT